MKKTFTIFMMVLLVLSMVGSALGNDEEYDNLLNPLAVRDNMDFFSRIKYSFDHLTTFTAVNDATCTTNPFDFGPISNENLVCPTGDIVYFEQRGLENQGCSIDVWVYNPQTDVRTSYIGQFKKDPGEVQSFDSRDYYFELYPCGEVDCVCGSERDGGCGTGSREGQMKRVRDCEPSGCSWEYLWVDRESCEPEEDIEGCTDSDANNYNPSATVKKGCTYDLPEGDSGWIGTPVFTPERIKEGDSIVVTQIFHASEEGDYWLESGSGWNSAWVPQLQASVSIVNIEKNSCNASERWYNNKKVHLIEGDHTITFKIIPSLGRTIESKSARGEYTIHTAWVNGCGLGTVEGTNIIKAEKSLYVGVPSGSKLCGETCSAGILGFGSSKADATCETGWCYNSDVFDGDSCQPEGTTSDSVKDNKLLSNANVAELNEGGVCITKYLGIDLCKKTISEQDMANFELKTPSGQKDFRLKNKCIIDDNCCDKENSICVSSEDARGSWANAFLDWGNDNYGFCLGEAQTKPNTTTTSKAFSLTFKEWKEASIATRMKTLCKYDDDCLLYEDVETGETSKARCIATTQVQLQLEEDIEKVCDSSKSLSTKLAIGGGIAGGGAGFWTGCAIGSGTGTLALPGIGTLAGCIIGGTVGGTTGGFIGGTTGAGIGKAIYVNCESKNIQSPDLGACIVQKKGFIDFDFEEFFKENQMMVLGGIAIFLLFIFLAGKKK